jgi:mono/diheme cytochrome c family protein
MNLNMNQQILGIVLLASAAIVGLGFAFEQQPPVSSVAEITRGKYLVSAMGCTDCHTASKLGPDGPVKDESMFLAGHPQGVVLPPAPQLPEGPWVVTVAGSLTAWSGPWGTSFTANLTPDKETGLGLWSLQDYIATIRTGRHLGRGREILPPMPYEQVATLSDEDLGAVFSYLQSLPPISNRVPEPLPPIERR